MTSDMTLICQTTPDPTLICQMFYHCSTSRPPEVTAEFCRRRSAGRCLPSPAAWGVGAHPARWGGHHFEQECSSIDGNTECVKKKNVEKTIEKKSQLKEIEVATIWSCPPGISTWRFSRQTNSTWRFSRQTNKQTVDYFLIPVSRLSILWLTLIDSTDGTRFNTLWKLP